MSFIRKIGSFLAAHKLLALMLLAAFLGVISIAYLLFPYYSNNHDEGVYIFQAQMLAQGKLSLPVNENSDFFQAWFYVNDGQKIYPKYQPVYAALLAPGQILFHNLRVMLGIIAVLNILLLYLLAREMYDKKTALLAAAFCLLSPLFLIQSSTFLPYTSSFLFNLLFALFFVKALKWDSKIYPIVAGLALGVGAFSRPLTTLLFALPFIAYSLYLVSGQDMAKYIKKFGLLVAVILPFFALVVFYNYYLTGSPAQFPFMAYEPLDRFGFGIKRMAPFAPAYIYNIPAALTSSRASIISFTEWAFGGFLSLSLVLFYFISFRPNKYDLLLLGLFPSIIVGEAFHWGQYNLSEIWKALDYLGPFYHFDLLLPLSLLASRGLFSLLPTLQPRSNKKEIWLSPRVNIVALVVILLGINALYLSQKIDLNYQYTQKFRDIAQTLKEKGTSNSIIFLPTPYGPFIHHPLGFLLNDPSFNASTVYARDMGSRNLELMSAYPGRKYYYFMMESNYSESPKERVTGDLVQLNHLEKGEQVFLDMESTNRTNKRYVFAYVWNNGRTQTYLLDNNSQLGKTYHITWQISPTSIVLRASFLKQIGELGSLSPQTTLNAAVAFSDDPERSSQQIYEYRYWFTIQKGNVIMAANGSAWRNEAWPQGPWQNGGVTTVFRMKAVLAATP